MDLNRLLLRLVGVVEFENARHRTAACQGFMIGVEAYALHLLAADGPGEGAIVEIGSYMGLSTSWLALGSMATQREPIHAIDHFQGSPEHQEGADAESAVLREEGTTYNRFLAGIEKAGVKEHVVPIVASSEQAAAKWDGSPIRLLFIDGEHSYEAVKKDYELWSPYVIENGIIAFHDIGNADGATKFYRETLETQPDCQELFQAGSLGVTVKTRVNNVPLEEVLRDA